MRIAWAIAGGLLIAPMVLFAVLSSVDSWNGSVVAPEPHFYVVSVTALLASAIGVTLLLCVRSVRETRTLFLGLGFVGLGMIFGAHGLSTPGFIVERGGYPYAVRTARRSSVGVAAD